MYKIITSLLALALTTAAFAQKVELKKEQMLVDGVPVAKAIKMDYHKTGIPDISLRNLNTNHEFLYAQWHQVVTETNPRGGQQHGSWWDICFLDSKIHVEFELGNSFFYVKDFLKMIYKNDLIKDGAIDPEALNVFITKFGSIRPFENYRNISHIANASGDIEQQTNEVIMGTEVVGGKGMIQRDHTKPVQFVGSQILQDGVLIGTFTYQHAFVAGTITDRVAVFFPNGIRVGEGLHTGYDLSVKNFFVFNCNTYGTTREIRLQANDLQSFYKTVVMAMIREGVL